MAAEAADLATEFEPAAVGEGRRRALRPTRTRLGDFFTNVGQTVGGAFDMFAGGADARLEGMRERSQTELAMENARKAREEARRLEAQRYADMNLESDLSIALGLPLHEAAAFANIMRGGYARDFPSITSGRGDIQEQGFRERIADPTLGEDFRVAAMEAIEPAAAISAHARPTRSEPTEVVIDPETGRRIIVPRSEAIGMERGYAPPRGGMSRQEAVLRAFLQRYAQERALDIDPEADPLEELMRLQQLADQADYRNVAPPTGGAIRLGPDDRALYEQLPSGTVFIDPEGFRRVKP